MAGKSDAIPGLVRAGIPVHTCIDSATSIGAAQDFSAMGLEHEHARDAFVRYAKEGATVISFRRFGGSGEVRPRGGPRTA